MPDSIRLNSIAVKNQKAILNYVFKYSSKINSIKSKSVVSAGNSAASGKTGGNDESKTEGKGYMKFISSLFLFFVRFKINSVIKKNGDIMVNKALYIMLKVFSIFIRHYSFNA